MATKRDRLLKEIADLKEQRNLACLKHAPEDDVAAGQSHPDVREIEARIRDKRDEVDALDAEEG
jgi:hypothetical protein